jgi:hypothetical protein
VPPEDLSDLLRALCLQHGPHLLDRQVHAAELADQPGVAELVHVVAAVRRPRVNRGGCQDADLVVVPERVDRQSRGGREPADLHEASMSPSSTLGSPETQELAR